MSTLDDGIARVVHLGCPEVLAPVIRDFVNAVCECASDQKVGVLLVGSASRGELSWHAGGDEIEFFSDVEFLVGVERRSGALSQQIGERAVRIADRANLGTFFHIDYTLIEWSTLPKLDTKFFIFESKACGIDFCLEEVAPCLPTTTPGNLNRKELNEILVHRLSSIVHGIPAEYFCARLSAGDNQQLALNLAKNTLDITTWLHPYESAALVAGYGNRLGQWRGPDFKMLTLSGFFSDEDIQYVDSCLALRQAPATSVDARQMLHKTLELYLQAIRYCKHMNGIGEDTPINDARASRTLFDEYRWRLRAVQSVSVLRRLGATGVSRLGRNLFGVRRGLAVAVCIDLIQAALQSAVDEARAEQSLAGARQKLSKVTRLPVSTERGFSQRWLATRDAFRTHQEITHNF